MKKKPIAGISGRIENWRRKFNEISRKGKRRAGDGVGSDPQKNCVPNTVFLYG